MTNEHVVIIEKDLWKELRKIAVGKMMQCHDCRALRDLMVGMMDMISVPEVEEPENIKPPEPLSTRAHSTVLMKEPTTVVQEKDGTTIVHEKTRVVE